MTHASLPVPHEQRKIDALLNRRSFISNRRLPTVAVVAAEREELLH